MDNAQSHKPKASRMGKWPRMNKWRRMNRASKVAIAAVAAVIAFIAVLWYIQQDSLAGQYAFQVGKPGPGAMAPPIRLPAARGNTFDLASYRGKTVLLYFQEGVTCQPCWDQLKDIEKSFSQFRAAGIDTLVTITVDPVDLLKQKASEEHLFMPVTSDASLAVSRAYTANSYGMMGQSRDGHTFIVVGPDGRIEWRADYGGAPNYTMFVPVPNLLADLRRGLKNAPR
jgi:peroxiredoxin Q/BCP